MTELTAESFVSRFGPRVARMMARGGAVPSKLTVRQLKRSDHSLTMRLDHAETTMVVKAYDNTNAAARNACRHEIPILMALRGTGLAPAIRGYSVKDSFFATDFVSGETILELPEDQLEPTLIARKIGAWLAEFGTLAPTQTAQTNWLDYLRGYADLDLTRLTPEHREFLGGLPITALSIAKNDAHLSNYLLTPADELIGLDFEAAAFKPVGWDILLTARTLALRWPEVFGQVLTALISGWPANDGVMKRTDLRKLATLFAGLTAFRPFDDNRSRTDRYLERYNKNSPTKAKYCVQVPWAQATIVPHRREDLNRFKAHLLIQARAAYRQAEADQRAVAPEQESEVKNVAALCTTCRGKCCFKGRENQAFLKPTDLARLVETDVASDPKAILDHYLSFIPDGHVAGSCLFHHKDGCAIPKPSRSATCNDYLCSSANEFLNRVEATETPGALLVVSVEELQPKRATISDQEKLELVDIAQLSK